MNKPLLEGAKFIQCSLPLIRDDKGKLLPEYSEPLVSYYENIRSNKPKQVSIYSAINFIHSERLEHKITAIRKAVTKADKDKLKLLLPAITVSGIFNGGHSEKNLIRHSGLISIDFDNVPNLEQLKISLHSDPFTFCCFISPSGRGVKVIVKISNDRHNESFTELSNYYLKKYHLAIDKSCKDVSRLMFLSHDTTIYLNPYSMQFNNTTQNVENIISQIEAKRHDITGSYDNWFKIGCAISSEFKETGRDFFHRISRFSPKYEIVKTDKQYNECLKERKNGIRINTFFKYAKDAGLNIYNHIKESVIHETEQTEKLTTNKFDIVEKFIKGRYDIRNNTVSKKIECAIKGTDKFNELNDNDLYVEIRKNNISFPQSDLLALLRASNIFPYYNPLQDYFENLPHWDEKTDHILSLCSYIKTKDQERFNSHFKKALVRCIACSLGNSFNKQAFILLGGQHCGKSTFIRWLCPPILKPYLTETFSTDKDGLISLCANFMINLDELAYLVKFDKNGLKSMLSKDYINVRLWYDKKQTLNKRIANFFGSTNEDEILTDETGNVRWLCFEVINIDWKNYPIQIDINNVWAEAYALYKQGFKYELSTKEIEENERVNADFQQRTPEIELIQKYLEPAKKGDTAAVALTATEILHRISYESNGILKISPQNIGKALRFLKYEKVSERTGEEKESRKVYWIKFRNN